MSSFLFILIIDWITKNSTEQERTGIRWTLLTNLEDLDFADDIALISHTRSHLQLKTVRINKLAVGLKINIGKTKVMSNETTKEPVFINNQPLDYTGQFTYLGSVVSISGGTEEDVTARLGKARSTFARLKPVWKSNAYSRATKLRIYKSNVLPVLLYGAECWRMTAKDLSRLSTFHTTCLRRIMRVFWPNRFSNSALLEATKQEPMNIILKRKRWRWVGHTLRMEPSAHARIALTWTPEGRRKRGRPRSTWRWTMLGEL